MMWIRWGYAPPDFWRIHPREFWWIVEEKREYADKTPSADYAGMSRAEVEAIYRETYGDG